MTGTSRELLGGPAEEACCEPTKRHPFGLSPEKDECWEAEESRESCLVHAIVSGIVGDYAASA